MADFTADLQSFRHSVPYLGIDPISMEPINQFAGISQSTLQNSTMNLQDFMPNFSSIGSSFSLQAPDFPGNWTENFQGVINPGNQNTVAVSHPIVTEQKEFQESKKRKAMDLSESSSGNSSPRVSESGIKRSNGSGKGKRGKGNDEIEKQEEKKPKEVVHVRARRGQATDSHSLAEREGKINEKLRCLQDIVPGCYKTMGMAVMLDEIINYVQSLQNQVEFLSMKLSAASTYYDFNSETDDVETMQRAKAQEAKEMERLMRGGGYGGPSCFISTGHNDFYLLDKNI